MAEAKPTPNAEVEIEVCERAFDYAFAYDSNGVRRRYPKYHASVKGEKAWACGASRNEAIGDLILHHPELFGVKITFLTDQIR